MDLIDETPEEFHTYEGRLASFSIVHKKRSSNANSRATKTIRWPHNHLLPADLARAGWYYAPHPGHPDQVICFLCRKGLDGWERGDDPLLEHLRHSADCGWAILTAVEAEVEGYATEDPGSPRMIEARKATFHGRWPHETKKGWKCKTKQLVEAGWKYTPTPESDDMATCAHCHLALDGWEPGDKPMEEHYTRSPECPFFALTAERKTTKASRARKPTASKAGRLSAQSVATAVSEVSHVDLVAENDDSIVTTASTATQNKGRTKKASAPRGKKTGVRKGEMPSLEADLEEGEEPALSEPPRALRGKKRSSLAMDDANVARPATKRRTNNTPKVKSDDTSQLHAIDDGRSEETSTPPKQAPAKKSRASNTRRATRKTSTTHSSAASTTASLHSAPDLVPDDDEIDRRLEADLERPLTDDEDISADSDSERRKKSSIQSNNVVFSPNTDRDYAMFDPTPAIPDEDVVDAEFEAMASEMKEPDPITKPRKVRKASTRKLSKQTARGESAAIAEVEKTRLAEATESIATEQSMESDIDMSSTTVVMNTTTSSVAGATKKARGRPPKKRVSSDIALVDPIKHVEIVLEAGPRGDCQPAEASSTLPSNAPDHKTSQTLQEKELPPPPPARASRIAFQPSTPCAHISPVPSAHRAVLSPSQSPQSSDAENQPPSSKPIIGSAGKHVALVPVKATPRRGSPSKRHRVAGLKSTNTWTTIDVEQLFSGLHDPNGDNDLVRFMSGGGELPSPEKRMTVEEWIYHNANVAEQRLKGECEALVSKFEDEGSKAMRVLEGLVVE